MVLSWFRGYLPTTPLSLRERGVGNINKQPPTSNCESGLNNRELLRFSKTFQSLQKDVRSRLFTWKPRKRYSRRRQTKKVV